MASTQKPGNANENAKTKRECATEAADKELLVMKKELSDPNITVEKLEELRPSLSEAIDNPGDSESEAHERYDRYLARSKVWCDAASRFCEQRDAGDPVLALKELPSLSDEKLMELLKKMKPVVPSPDKLIKEGIDEQGNDYATYQNDGKLWYIKPVNPRNIAFKWSPKRTKQAEGLEVAMKIKTYHTYAAPVFFKPTIDEVLAQVLMRVPDEKLKDIVAFSTDTTAPYSSPFAELSFTASKAFDGGWGYHVATTTLYALKEGASLGLLYQESKPWSPKTEAKARKARIGLVARKRKESEAAGKRVLALIEEAETDPEEAHLTAYRQGGIRKGILTLFRNIDYASGENNALYVLLEVLNKKLESGELRALQAGLALDMVHEFFSTGKYCDTEISAYNHDWRDKSTELAKNILLIVRERFAQGRMDVYTAEHLIENAEPFIPTRDDVLQLLLVDVKKPILERSVASYLPKLPADDDRHRIMNLLRG